MAATPARVYLINLEMMPSVSSKQSPKILFRRCNRIAPLNLRHGYSCTRVGPSKLQQRARGGAVLGKTSAQAGVAQPPSTSLPAHSQPEGGRRLWAAVRTALAEDDLSGCLAMLVRARHNGANLPKRFRWSDQQQLMRLCARCGSVEQGLVAAAMLPKFELAALNEMMNEYASLGSFTSAISLLSAMEQHPTIKPDEYTCTAVIKACGSRGKTQSAVKIMKKMIVKLDISPNLRIYNALLNAVSTDLQLALQVFVDMEKEELLQPDPVTFNTLMKACVEGGEPERALRMRTHMRALGVPMDEITYGTLINACAKCNPAKVEEAFDLFEEMQSEPGLETSVIIWCTLMLACCRAEQVERAFTVKQLMLDSGCEPNTHVYNLLMNACTSTSQWERTLKLHSEMVERGVEPDVLTWNSLMQARSNLADDPIEGAVACLVESITQAGMSPSVQTWGQLIDICAEQGDTARASLAFEQMTATGIQPDLTAYSSLLKAHTASGNLDSAMALYHSLHSSDLQTTGPLYGMLINECLEQRDVPKALELYNDMRAAGLAPSNRLFRQLLEMMVDRDFTKMGDSDDNAMAYMSLFSRQSYDLGSDHAGGKSCIDLHGMSTVEARAAVLCVLKTIQQLHKSGARPQNQDLVIITGAGRSRQDGKSHVRDAVIKLLEQLQLDIQISTPNMAIEESELSLDNTQETSLQEHAIVGDYMIATGDSTTNEGRIIVTKESLSRWLSAKKSTSKPAAPVDAPAVLPSATTNEPETSEAGAKEVIGSKKSVANLETVGKSKPSEKIKQKKQKKQKKAKKQKEPVKDKDDVELAEEEENLLFRQEGDYFVYTFEN